MPGTAPDGDIALRFDLAPPPRRGNSLRRTASWSSTWPDGLSRPMRMEAIARDLFTPASGAGPDILSTEALVLHFAPDRTILSIGSTRPDRHLLALVGRLPGGPVRKWMAEEMPDGAQPGGLLHLLLDDLAGASLVTPGAWMAWRSDWQDHYRSTLGEAGDAFDRDVENVCIGFRGGSAALTANRSPDFPGQYNRSAPPPLRADDPRAWHAWPVQPGPGHRRTRRIDLWIEEDGLAADIGFQDSNALPGTDHRRIVHDYRVRVRIDPHDLTLRTLDAAPGVLPYRECLAAALNAQRMVGRPVAAFRRDVPRAMPGAEGCTHLNDVLRGLADIGPMADLLQAGIDANGADTGLAAPSPSC